MEGEPSRSTPWIHGLRGRLALALGTFLLCFLAGEFFVRLRYEYWTPETLRERVLEYEQTLFSRMALPRAFQTRVSVHSPGQHTDEQGTRLDILSTAVINERGYRGEPFAAPKDEDTVRIIVLGGSSAFDIDAVEGQDWPSIAERHLHRLGHQRVEVINAATPAHASWDNLGRLYAEIWMFEPDYLLLYNAYNDIHYFSWVGPDQSLLRGYRPPAPLDGRGRNSPLARRGDLQLMDRPDIYYRGTLDRLASHSQIYVRLRARYFEWKLQKNRPRSDTFSPWGPRQYGLHLALIADAARNIGAEPVFVVQARMVTADNTPEEIASYGGILDTYGLTHGALVRAFEACDRELAEVAARKAVPVLDLSSRFSGERELFVDHVHTTALGSRRFGEAVGDFLARLLEPAGHPAK